MRMSLLLFALVLTELHVAPDGTFVQGQPQVAPDGTFVGGRPQLAPDGTFVGDGADPAYPVLPQLRTGPQYGPRPRQDVR